MATRLASASENALNSSTASARTVRDIARELKALLQSPPEGIRLLLTGDDADCISTVHTEIDGPVGTPYEGGVFRMKLEFGAEFPNQPPKGYFLTRIFHPNISKNGEICVNTLKRDWKPTLGLRHILIVVRCLLIEPYPESALNEEAGKMLLDDYEEYAHHARLMTSIHAMPRRPAAAAAPAEQPKSSASVGTPPGGAGATPLTLNSTIANADGDVAGANTSRSSEGHSGLPKERAADKAEKKKVDTRKKALKRL